MTTTAFDAMLELAQRLGMTYQGNNWIATDGSSSTLVDADLDGGSWTGGTVFIITDAGGEGAVPENESREVKSFDDGTDTVTVYPAWSAAVGIGDVYAITKNVYPRWVLLRSLNAALRWWDDIIHHDDTTLDTAADTLEYSLPTAAVSDLYQVRIASNDSSPYDFRPFPYWSVNEADGKLVFRVQPDYVRDIRLIYMAPHAALTGDSSTIDAQVNLESIYLFALFECYMWILQKVGHDDQTVRDMANMSLQRAEQEKARHPKKIPPRDPSLPYLGQQHRTIWDRLSF